MTNKELIEIPPQLYCGGVFREKRLNSLFYGNMHGEDIISKSNADWTEDFIREFAAYQVPFHFLCTHKRLALKGHFMNERCEFSDGTTTYRRHRRITQNGETIKLGNELFLPYVHEKDSYFVYSENGFAGFRKVSAKSGTATVFEISPDGLKEIETAEISNSQIHINVKPKHSLLVRVNAVNNK